MKILQSDNNIYFAFDFPSNITLNLVKEMRMISTSASLQNVVRKLVFALDEIKQLGYCPKRINLSSFYVIFKDNTPIGQMIKCIESDDFDLCFLPFA